MKDTKKSPKGPKKVTNGPQSEPQKVSKWSPKGLKVVTKRSQSGFQEVPKWFPKGPKVVSKRLIQHSGADEDRFDKGCTGGWPPS